MTRHGFRGWAGCDTQLPMEGTPICGSRHRVLRHAWVLVAAVLLPLAAPAATPPVAGAGGSDNSAANTASIQSTDAPLIVSRPAQTIVVAPGETLQVVATTYHVDVASLRWANNISDGSQPLAGSTLLVPPSAGALVLAHPGEKPSHVAARLGVDATVLLDYNQLQRDAPLAAGTYLQIPQQDAPHDALLADEVVPNASGVPGVSVDQRSRGNIYPYGQCTWYAASRRNVTWTGNAVAWWTASQGIRPRGHVPAVNAIVVMNVGYVGHVGIVDSINPDGTFVMSEMNYYGNGGGWGRVDQRTMTTTDPTIMGFIY